MISVHRFRWVEREGLRHCLMTVPPPFTMGDGWREPDKSKRQMDLSKALQDGAKCFWVSFQQKHRHQVIVPTQTTAIIILEK